MLSRRELFTAGSGIVGMSVLTHTAAAQDKKPFRVAHITDVHITDAREASAGVAAMFQHMFGKNWAPELVLNTGDTVMAVDGRVPATRARVQIDLWKAARKLCPAPVYSSLGNHDVWSGHDANEDIPEKKSGFTLMTEVLEMPAPYYSFDKGGWHFICLNSVCNWPDYGILTPEHFEWLKNDLAKTPASTPIVVFSHLPIVSVTSSLQGDSQRRNEGVMIPKVWQHVDCWAISELFRNHPNVKLCLSGHMHTCDRCEYRGVWYICGGAVSGSWWNGSEFGFPPLYGALDLYPDGTFEYKFVDYGWKNRKWNGKQLKL